MGKKFWANVILCVLIGGVASVVLANIHLTPKGILITDSEPSSAAAPILDKVVLADYELAKGADHMVIGKFTVSNLSDKEIKNVDVLCEFYDEAGNYLDRERWLLGGRIPAGETMHHSSAARRYIHTRSKQTKCQIVDVALAQPPFFKLHRAKGGHGGGGHAEAAASGEHGSAPATEHESASAAEHGSAEQGHQ